MKILALNKKARFDYSLLDTFEAGIELTGAEVKSVVVGSISLKESYVRFVDGEAFLWNAHIARYKFSSGMKDEKFEYRTRKLLLHKNQINKITQEMKLGGLTVVPTRVYLSNKSKIKLEIALAKGKRNYDKRESIKKREIAKKIREY